MLHLKYAPCPPRVGTRLTAQTDTTKVETATSKTFFTREDLLVNGIGFAASVGVSTATRLCAMLIHIAGPGSTPCCSGCRCCPTATAESWRQFRCRGAVKQSSIPGTAAGICGNLAAELPPLLRYLVLPTC